MSNYILGCYSTCVTIYIEKLRGDLRENHREALKTDIIRIFFFLDFSDIDWKLWTCLSCEITFQFFPDYGTDYGTFWYSHSRKRWYADRSCSTHLVLLRHFVSVFLLLGYFVSFFTVVFSFGRFVCLFSALCFYCFLQLLRLFLRWKEVPVWKPN